MTTATPNESVEIRRITLADGRYLIFYTFDPEFPDRDGVTDRHQNAESASETDQESSV